MTLPYVSATPAACAQAVELGVEGVLENVVSEAILAGDLIYVGKPESKIRIGDHVAFAKRDKSPLTRRKAWRVIRVARLERRRAP